MKIISLLENLEISKIVSLLGKSKFKQIEKIISKKLSKDEILHLSEILFENTFFEDIAIKKELLNLIDSRSLSYFSKRYLNKTFDSKQTMTIQLASQKWSRTNPLSFAIFDSLGLDWNYLPLKESTEKTIEVISPHKAYYPLFPYQEKIKERILNNLDNKINRFLVQMPTGSGKTKTSLEGIFEYFAKNNCFETNFSILWLAHTEELCEQAFQTAINVWIGTQNKDLKIVRFWGGYNPTIDELRGSFIVSSYQKMSSNKTSLYYEFIKKFVRIIIVDEAHKAIAPTYQSMLNSICISNNFLIGLTATPGRSVNNQLDNSKLSSFFYRNLIDLQLGNNTIKELKKMGILSNLQREVITSEIDIPSPEAEEDDNSYEYSSNQLKSLSNNEKRNIIIIDLIKKEVERNNPTLVFTCSVEHSVILTTILRYYNIKAEFVDSSLSKSKRREIITKFKNKKVDVLLNFGVLTTGFDAPVIKTVIITRPTTSIVLYSQMIGRGLRGYKVGGNRINKLIDIKDHANDFGASEYIYNYFKEYWS